MNSASTTAQVQPVSITYQLSNMMVAVQCSTQNEQDAVKRFAAEGGFPCPAPELTRPVYHCSAKTHPLGEILWG